MEDWIGDTKFFNYFSIKLINCRIVIASSMSEEDKLKQGPREGVVYPLQVIYCGNCTMPIEVSTYFLTTICRKYLDLYSFTFIVLWILSWIWKMQTMVGTKFTFWIWKGKNRG